jgi:toxin-antitoxin system PIN domain toxin
LISLLDVNVLIALMDEQHIHHSRVMQWFSRSKDLRFATCAITQMGFVRVISQATYLNPIGLSQAFQAISRLASSPGHVWWPQHLQIHDKTVFDHSRIHGHRQLTDLMLLALAVQNKGRLVTLDAKLPLAAVVGARPQHLLVI